MTGKLAAGLTLMSLGGIIYVSWILCSVIYVAGRGLDLAVDLAAVMNVLQNLFLWPMLACLITESS